MNNQFRILEECEQQSFACLRERFGSQLRKVGRMICLFDRLQNAEYPKRLWCLFEVFTAVENDIPMTVIIPETGPQEVEVLLQSGIQSLRDAISVNSETATASFKEDEQQIKDLITHDSSYSIVNCKVERELRTCVVMLVNDLLATSHSSHAGHKSGVSHHLEAVDSRELQLNRDFGEIDERETHNLVESVTLNVANSKPVSEFSGFSAISCRQVCKALRMLQDHEEGISSSVFRLFLEKFPEVNPEEIELIILRHDVEQRGIIKIDEFVKWFL